MELCSYLQCGPHRLSATERAVVLNLRTLGTQGQNLDAVAVEDLALDRPGAANLFRQLAEEGRPVPPDAPSLVSGGPGFTFPRRLGEGWNWGRFLGLFFPCEPQWAA